MTFSASGAAPIPLYQEYQSHFGLTPFMVTVIFATYVLCLLLALLTVGSLSDYIGRRPAILSALAMNVVAMLIFMMAQSAGVLIVARAVQGFATGLATTTLGATILDTDREHAPVLNSVTAFAGLSAGTLGAGLLVTFTAPDSHLRGAACPPPSKRPSSGHAGNGRAQARCAGVAAAAVRVPPRPSTLRPSRRSPLRHGLWAASLLADAAVVRIATGTALPVIGGVVVATVTSSGRWWLSPSEGLRRSECSGSASWVSRSE